MLRAPIGVARRGPSPPSFPSPKRARRGNLPQMRLPKLLLAALCGHGLTLPIHAAELPPFTPGRSEITFTKSAQQSGADEVKWRLHAEETPGAYDVRKEKFRGIVPPAYTHATPHGLFIWIDSGAGPKIAREWEPILAARKLIFIGAFNSGNPRPIFDRARLDGSTPADTAKRV